MNKYQLASIILIILLLPACAGSINKSPIKFVNHLIPAKDAKTIFTKDSNYCAHESTSNRPVIYKDCRVYSFNPSMRQQCSSKNEYILLSYKKLTKKIYKKCLLSKGWKEETTKKEEVTTIKIINKVTPIYPKEAVSSCIEGQVTLEFNIKNEGSVKDISILKAKPNDVFNTSAINAISKWEFAAKPIGSQKKERRVKQTLYFKLNKPCCDNKENIDNDCKVTKEPSL